MRPAPKLHENEDMSGVLPMDREIFELHNMIRQNPQSVLGDLQDMLNMFEKDVDFVRGEGRSTLRTNEGIAAVEDAIEFIKKQAPVKPLRWSNLMAEASKFHTLDIGPIGQITHHSTKD